MPMTTEVPPPQENGRTWGRERGKSLIEDRDEQDRLKGEKIFI